MRNEFARIDQGLRESRLTEETDGTRCTTRDTWQRQFDARMNETAQRVDAECAVVRDLLRASAQELRQQMKRVEKLPKFAEDDNSTLSLRTLAPILLDDRRDDRQRGDDVDAEEKKAVEAVVETGDKKSEENAVDAAVTAAVAPNNVVVVNQPDDEEEFFDVDDSQFPIVSE
jgi:hypothetical protein